MRHRDSLSSLTRALLLVVCVMSAGCREQILHDLSEQDANKVLSRLSGAELRAEKVAQSDGRWAIAVPDKTIVPALAYLDAHRVLAPRAVSNSGAKSGLVPSREEQWFRYERSVATVIEESIGALLGVLDARVHLNLPETDPLFGTRQDDRGSGSVLVVVDTRYVAKPEEVAALVAGAAGIPASRVTVLRSVAQTPTEESLVREHSGHAEEVSRERETRSQVPSISLNPDMLRALIGISGILLCVASGGLLLRRRKRRVRFCLPESIVREES